jgi:predicted TIM-barrel fold metal-dependent hydrolase
VIIDAHCHVGKGDLLTGPWDTDAPLEPYLSRARAAGISRTVVFPPFHSNYTEANAQLARLISRHSGRLIGFAMVNTRKDRGRIADIVGVAVRRWDFRGIKIHGSEGMPTREVCETARAWGIPLLVDVVGKADVIDLIAPQYPGVRFIVAHLGSFMDDWRAHQRVIDQLIRYPNLFADTSGVRRFDYLVQAVERAGAHKLLFGSDGPWLHPGLELYKIKLLAMHPSDEKLVLGRNAWRLLHRTHRDSRELSRGRFARG